MALFLDCLFFPLFLQLLYTLLNMQSFARERPTSAQVSSKRHNCGRCSLIPATPNFQWGEKLRPPKNSAHQNRFCELRKSSQFLCYCNQFFTSRVACCFSLSARHGLFLEEYRFKRYHVLSTTKTAFWVSGIPVTGTQQLHFQCFCIWFGLSFLLIKWPSKDICHWME